MTHLIHQHLSSSQLLKQLILITLAVHGILAFFTPLTVDEAHYALYGKFLDWSYFDHPPMVGWLQSLILVFGEQEWLLRLWPMLSYTLTLLLLHGYTRFLTHSLISANLAILLFSLIPITHALGVGLVPDTLLLPLAIALIWQAQRTLNQPRIGNWLLIGLLIGLSALSKYTSILLALGLLLVLINSQYSWRWLTQSGFWLSIIIAGICTLPILYWNAQHDWISILYQLNHGRPDDAFTWTNLAQSQLSQLLLYTPLIWFASWQVIVNIKQHWASQHNRQLILFILPGLLVFTLSSGKEPSLPHWLAFFYVLLLPLIAHQFVNSHSSANLVIKANILYGLLITCVMFGLSLAPKLTEHWSPNPTQDLIGWKEAAKIAQALREKDENLIVSHWVDASRIAWYARPTKVTVMDNRFDQFDIWFGSPDSQTSGILILPPERQLLDWHNLFSHCQRLAYSGDGFQFLRCYGAKIRP